MTGTLIYRKNQGKIAHILFRKMPNHDSNNKAPFRITEKLTARKPELVRMPDLKQSGNRSPKEAVCGVLPLSQLR